MEQMIWHISISDMILNFRNALIAILPQMEYAHIEWADGAQYNDYDKIAEALYESFVAMNFTYDTDLVLTRYGFNNEEYQHKNFVAIDAPELGIVPFVQFKTVNEPYDSVEVAMLKDDVAVELRVLSLNGLKDKFLFVRNNGVDRELVYEINVEL